MLENKRGSYNDCLLPFVLAEHDYDPAKPDWQDGALKASKDYAKRFQNEHALMDSRTVLCLLGRKEEAVKASQELLPQLVLSFYPLRQAPILRCVAYNAGELTADELVKAAKGSRWDQCLAHYHVAMTKLAEGDRKGAQEHFEKVVKTRAFIWGAYDMSWVFQARLEKDRNWPPWIPPRRAK